MDSDDGQKMGLNYELLVEDSLRMVVRAALTIVERAGLPGDTHFFISFSTQQPGVEMEESLLRDHPDTITIVIQHQYADLIVEDDKFSVTLFFGGKPSPMVVPFDAVTNFNDPSVGFGLQFGGTEHDESFEIEEGNIISAEAESVTEQETADVVQLDSFRKNPS
tara:strand:+ start:177 stop:668 length:492 start_codon:yes stop_codon:yes gene_type:complete